MGSYSKKGLEKLELKRMFWEYTLCGNKVLNILQNLSAAELSLTKDKPGDLPSGNTADSSIVLLSKQERRT